MPASNPPESFAFRVGRLLAPDEVLAGLEAGRWMIVPGRRARLTRRLAQLVPGLMNAITDRMVVGALSA